MKDGGALANVQIDGADADVTLIDGQTTLYTLNSGKTSTKLDISAWTWFSIN
jgi:competence protein ComGC